MRHSAPGANSLPAIIIGAGQAGIALSYCLQQRGVTHLVLEKERPFADWHNRRWDSFAMNTPNWMNILPGQKQPFAPTAKPTSYGTIKDALEYFDAYLHAVQPPLLIEEVTHVGVNRDGSWEVVTSDRTYRAQSVAICTGHAARPHIPAVASGLPASVRQLHSSEYRHPTQIESANVLVVGSGSSGVQICHELARSRRFEHIYLAESGNFTLPWTVLGIPIYSFMQRLGVFNITRNSWVGRMLFPILLQKGDPATPPSPRRLARMLGVRRTGRVAANAASGIRCSDAQLIPFHNLAVVWCTGFRASFDFLDEYVRQSVLDEDRRPIQHRGVATNAPGIYFVGLRFQHTLVSQDIYGVGRDAQYVADQISRRHAASTRQGYDKTRTAATDIRQATG